MDIDQDERIARQLVSQLAQDRIGKLELGFADEPLRCPEGIELESLEALRDHRLRRIEEGLGTALGAIPAIGIAQDALAQAAAQQLMDRRSERLAENIPAGDLDRRDDGAVDMAAVERDALEQALGDCPCASWILPDDEMLELANAGLGGTDEAVERALAYAVDAFVGVNLDEEPVLPAGA